MPGTTFWVSASRSSAFVTSLSGCVTSEMATVSSKSETTRKGAASAMTSTRALADVSATRAWAWCPPTGNGRPGGGWKVTWKSPSSPLVTVAETPRKDTSTLAPF